MKSGAWATYLVYREILGFSPFKMVHEFGCGLYLVSFLLPL
jgi:hypothetical protein